MLLTGWREIDNPKVTEYRFILEIIYIYIYTSSLGEAKLISGVLLITIKMKKIDSKT